MSIKELSLSELNELKGITNDMMKYYDFCLSTHRELNSLDYQTSMKDKTYSSMLKKRNNISNFYQKINVKIENKLKEFEEWED